MEALVDQYRYFLWLSSSFLSFLHGWGSWPWLYDCGQGELTARLQCTGHWWGPQKQAGLLPRWWVQEEATLGHKLFDSNPLPGRLFHFFSDCFFAFILGFNSLLHLNMEEAILSTLLTRVFFFPFLINCFGLSFSSLCPFSMLPDPGGHHRKNLLLLLQPSPMKFHQP